MVETVELGCLVCKACGRVVGKVFAEEPRREGKPRRTCFYCVRQVVYDSTVGTGVAP